MRRTSRLRTEIICSHHDTVLVFDREDAGSGNNGLSMQKWVQPRDKRETWLDGLGALNPLGKVVLYIVGPLMNRVGSVGIKGVVSL